VGCHEYDTSGTGGHKDAVHAWVVAHNVPPRGHRWNVLFLDEAQALTRRAADAILKMVEEPARGVIFCFATTEFERIRPALRSRLIGFEIKPLSPAEGIRLLEHCARAEGIDYDPGALELLSGLSQGYARDLLNGLEQVCDPSGRPISVARVRDVFDVDHTDFLLAYVGALAAGNPAAQNQAWLSWHESAAAKLSWLKALLTAFYYNDVLGQALIVDALIASILPAERAPILAAFQDRLGVTSATALAPYWRAMMTRMAETVGADETALELRVALFHDFVNRELPSLESGTRSTSVQQLSVTGAASLAANKSSSSKIAFGGENRFPTFDDVRSVIAAASYLAQEHGRLFNAHITLEPALVGVESEAEAVAPVATFCEELESHVASWSSEPFAFLSLLERDLDRGGQVAGRILVHLPEPTETGRSVDAGARVVEWAQRWRRETWLAGYDAVVVQTPTTEKARQLTFHWEKVLDLCAGLPEEVVAWDPARSEPLPPAGFAADQEDAAEGRRHRGPSHQPVRFA
jgi:hypothetical protein